MDLVYAALAAAFVLGLLGTVTPLGRLRGPLSLLLTAGALLCLGGEVSQPRTWVLAMSAAFVALALAAAADAVRPAANTANRTLTRSRIPTL